MAGNAIRGEPARFFKEVVLTFQSDECLIWPYGSCRGYGTIKIDGTNITVHRLACIEVHGKPPSSEHESAHICGNGQHGCVNPRHVRWATPLENSDDKYFHGTMARGERCGIAKLNRSQVLEIRKMKGKISRRDLATMYGVSTVTIASIHLRTTWGWLHDDGSEAIR